MAQLASARGLGPRGRRFESCYPDQPMSPLFVDFLVGTSARFETATSEVVGENSRGLFARKSSPANLLAWQKFWARGTWASPCLPAGRLLPRPSFVVSLFSETMKDFCCSITTLKTRIPADKPVFCYDYVMPIEAIKYFGLYSIVIFIAITAFIACKWHSSNSLTLSKHIASSRTPHLIFAVSSVIAQSLFWLFAVFWFILSFDLSPILVVVITLGSIGQITAAIVPDRGHGLQSTIHYYAACIMGLAMLSFTICVSLSTSFGGQQRLYSSISLIIMATFIILTFLVKGAKNNTLIYQLIYLLIFWSTVLVAAYL